MNGRADVDGGDAATHRPATAARRARPQRRGQVGWSGSVLVLLAFLGGCASPPIETELEPSPRTPAEVSAASGQGGDETLLWGGVLLESKVLGDATQLEVLAHPLDRRQLPQTGRASQGRFLIVADGYLETVDYAPGRLVTVLGTLDEVREGTIGEATVRFPVVRAEELHLWSPGAGRDERPGFTFGLGVSLGN